MTTVPESCPGTESETAGKSAACAGCPNQTICESAPSQEKELQKAQDEMDLTLIRQRTCDIRQIITVLSGKGGVGKSTVCAQLALALATGYGSTEAANVGVLDADICGPSVPILLGVQNEIVHNSASGWNPVTVFDDLDEGGGSLSCVSVGMMLENADDAIIWRGNKKHGLIKQFLRDVEWGPLDYLVVDTPPGTSDEHLSIVQCLKDSLVSGSGGAIIVTTPQEVALQDVRRELAFCRKVGIQVLGVIENMHGFVCPSCQGESDIFPVSQTSPTRKMCLDLDIPYLGSLPLDPRVTKLCDANEEGVGFMDLFPDAKWSLNFREILDNLKQQ